MKLKSGTDDLLATARKVLNVAPAKSPQPICSNVLLEADDEGAWLTATDLDVTVRTRLPALRRDNFLRDYFFIKDSM